MKKSQIVNPNSQTEQTFNMDQIRKVAEQVVAEYQHGGHADFKDVGVTEKQYVDVVNDFILCLNGWEV